jgi:hypothetical protein
MEETMLDRVKMDAPTPSVEIELTAEEQEIFSRARSSGIGVRRTFEAWLDIGRAAQVARRHADAAGGHNKKGRDARFRTIMNDNGLGWINSKSRNSEIVNLLKILERLKEVQAWRSTLSEFERARWASAQSVYNRCPIFHPDGKTKGPTIKARPMSVREWLHMPAADAAMMIHRRNPAKFFAIMRAMQEIAEAGSATRPVSGWAADRKRAAAGASVAAA